MQNETVFYAAVSSDGFLAGPNGDMTWAEKWLGSGEDYGYIQLVSSCSAMLMGSKTFDFELAAIGNQDRILPTYVLTTNPQRYDGVHGDVTLVAGDVSAAVDRIMAAHPGRLFVVGGADVARQLLEAGKLDVVVLTTVNKLSSAVSAVEVPRPSMSSSPTLSETFCVPLTLT